MIYTTTYTSPVGKLTLASEENMLIGLWLEGQKYYMDGIDAANTEIKNDEPALVKAKEWLDDYFNGKKPNINTLPLNPQGTDFQRLIWALLCDIPYGETTTYGDLSKMASFLRREENISAQAVGGAIGRNPISIIIPCHRIIGKDGSMVGYAGGTEAKEFLLKHENETK